MKPVQLMLTPEQHKALKQYALDHGTTMAKLVRGKVLELVGK